MTVLTNEWTMAWLDYSGNGTMRTLYYPRRWSTRFLEVLAWVDLGARDLPPGVLGDWRRGVWRRG
jgi:hypothetical protein